MVKRRSVLLGVSSCAVGGGYFALNRSGSDGRTMETNGQGRGCRNGVIERPENGTFEFVSILQFDELEVQIEVKEGSDVERIEVGSDGETIRTVSDVKAGTQKITFASGNATTFDVTVSNDDGSVIDTAQFYSRCSTQADDGNGTASS